MADDLDSGLSLNISVYHKDDHSGGKDRKKVFGNRGQRIKARRNIKRQRESSQHESSANNSGKTLPSRDNTEDAESSRQDVKETEPPVKKKTGDVISSLFRHNPDIPTVQGSVA
ncbi:hypothetical protein DPMN_137050 [Dreissena polymorpha]|nr:hypothetical protein DPMN_137050 [Dreissena polymorpha]